MNIQDAINKFTATGMTEDTAYLLVSFCLDAPNWNGSPMLDISKEDRGNLTDLKKRGLLNTWKDDGITYVFFTDAGKQLIKTTSFATNIS